LVVLRLRRRAPSWVWAGFLAGGALLLAPQVFYHYFVLFAPFAALLSAPLVAGIRRPTYRPITLLATCGLVWVAVVAMGDDRPLLVTTGHLSDLTPTVEVLRHETAPGGLVLADRYEYPFLSGRPTLAPYFWNVRPLVSGTTLEHQLPCAAAVVMSSGASSGYPQGLISYLDRHYRARRQGGATVWVLPATATATTGVRATGARVRPPCEKFVFVPRGPCPRERCVPAPSMDEIKLVSDRDKG
jgi:hypothetical protein